MSYLTQAGVEEIKDPKDSSWIDEILEKLHEHGKRCYCDDEEKGFTRVEAKAAIEAELVRIERLSFAKGYDQGCLDSQLSPKQKTKEWQHGYNSGWQKAGGRERAGINLKGGASDEGLR